MITSLFARVVFAVAILAAGGAVASEPIRIVCLGDSVTKAVRKGVLPEETFSAVLQKQLVADGYEVEVFNAGIGGNTTADGLKRFESDVLAHNPNYVVLMFGLNDSWIDAGKTKSRVSVADYRRNLDEMLGNLRSRGIRAILMTPNPALPPKYEPVRNATLKGYVRAVRDAAAEHHVPLLDVYQHFAELDLEVPDINSFFTDAMHPNPAGQQEIATLLHSYFTAEFAQR